MDQNQQDITFDEGLKEVVQALPPIVRAYLSEKKYIPVTKSLMETYSLHVDQGSILEREIVLLLMGVEALEEFKSSLKEEAKISEDVVNNIVNDIDEHIFFPLWEEEQKDASTSEVVETKKAIHHELPQVVRNMRVESPATTPQEKAPSLTAPQPEKTVFTPAAAPEISNPIAAQAATAANIPRIIVPVPATPPKTQEKPAPFPLPERRPETNAPKTPPPPIQSYTVDPYREPIV